MPTPDPIIFLVPDNKGLTLPPPEEKEEKFPVKKIVQEKMEEVTKPEPTPKLKPIVPFKIESQSLPKTREVEEKPEEVKPVEKNLKKVELPEQKKEEEPVKKELAPVRPVELEPVEIVAPSVNMVQDIPSQGALSEFLPTFTKYA